MYTHNPEYVKKKYNLKMLREIESYVAECVDVEVVV
jgi:homocitrate synthase